MSGDVKGPNEYGSNRPDLPQSNLRPGELKPPAVPLDTIYTVDQLESELKRNFGNWQHGKSPAEQDKIAQSLHAALEKSWQRGGELVFEVSKEADNTSINIALSDRPFIDTTIEEWSRRKGVSKFLKGVAVPELGRIKAGEDTSPSNQFAVVHLEFQTLPEPQQTDAINSLHAALLEVTIITDDFNSMVETLDRVASKVRRSPTDLYSSDYNPRTVATFLKWLKNDNFVLLGSMRWNVTGDGLVADPASLHGIYRSPDTSDIESLIGESKSDAIELLKSTNPFWVSRLSILPTVHRSIPRLNISVEERAENGEPVAVHSFVGIFARKGYRANPEQVPIIREKLSALTTLPAIAMNRSAERSVRRFLDGVPKDILLRLDQKALENIINKIVPRQGLDETRVAVTKDSAARGVYLVISTSQERGERLRRDKLSSFLADKFGGSSDSLEIKLDEDTPPFTRIHAYMPLKNAAVGFNESQLTTELHDLLELWEEKAARILTQDAASASRDLLTQPNLFPEEYKAKYPPETGAFDIINISTLSDDKPVVVTCECPTEVCGQNANVVIYSNDPKLTSGSIAPVLETASLKIGNPDTQELSLTEGERVYVHRLPITAPQNTILKVSEFNETVAPGIEKILLNKAENDRLNSLMVTAGLSLREVELARTFSKYIDQTAGSRSISGPSVKTGLAAQALVANPEIAKTLTAMFQVKFNDAVNLDTTERLAQVNEYSRLLDQQLRQVADLNQDAAIRRIAALIKATTRTNYFMDKEAIALKIDSSKLEFLPEPRPEIEIFTNSPRFEGVHLRKGLIARGGLRWSTRYSDYRKEILGLMATQHPKNAFIVPDGAKGGFIVKNLPEDLPKNASAKERRKYAQKVEETVKAAYREYITTLLDITDNLVDGRVRKPDNMITYDGDDYYLVVAADKGTAKFSDIANKIAIERGFWLKDAFASGGSTGYSHYELGITAKGAWESVERHFHELAIRFDKPYSATGIGDMGGDVFGNGLIDPRSQNMNLVAAYNHKHIYINPLINPSKDQLKAHYNERLRLFKAGGQDAGWDNYNRELIAEGGGVFDRNAKAIRVTAQMRAALSLDDSVPEEVSGEELIKLILKARVDLLWNGGIGTPVKSRLESNSDIGDPDNDAIRIDALDSRGNPNIRARVIAEGGNNMITQLARIELAENGVRLNRDSIDNACGVGCSDLEVNLKILLQRAIDSGDLTVAERNRLIKELTPDVESKTLWHNHEHVRVISQTAQDHNLSPDLIGYALRHFEDGCYLNRELDVLPTEEKLRERQSSGRGLLLRPEIAVILPAAKISVRNAIRESGLSELAVTRKL
ncbi:MAG: hypothetical protein D6719_09960, partial [Candidatus Dadabacteria bacterium]